MPININESTKEKLGNMKHFTSVSIIIPALNETYLLRKTIDIILDSCNKEDIEEIIIVLCDRTSSECIHTAEKIKNDYCAYPVIIYFQDKPFVGNAFQEAFEIANGTHIVTAAADMDMDPYAISKFIEKSKLFPDNIISASRWIPGGGFNGYKKFMLVLNYLFQKIIDVIFLTNLSDVTYGFRLYPKELLASIRWEESKHPFFLESCLKPLRLGTKFIEVPAVWNVRTEGTSEISFLKYLSYIHTVFHIRLMKKDRILKDTLLQ